MLFKWFQSVSPKDLFSTPPKSNLQGGKILAQNCQKSERISFSNSGRCKILHGPFRCGNRSCAGAWRRAGGAGHLGEGIASYRRGSNCKDSQIFSIHFGPLAKEVGISELTPVAQKKGWVERLVSAPLHFGGFGWISSTPCLGHTVLVVCVYIYRQL